MKSATVFAFMNLVSGIFFLIVLSCWLSKPGFDTATQIGICVKLHIACQIFLEVQCFCWYGIPVVLIFSMQAQGCAISLSHPSSQNQEGGSLAIIPSFFLEACNEQVVKRFLICIFRNLVPYELIDCRVKQKSYRFSTLDIEILVSRSATDDTCNRLSRCP